MTMDEIEWTEETWNPWRGCGKITPDPGGDCYARQKEPKEPSKSEP